MEFSYMTVEQLLQQLPVRRPKDYDTWFVRNMRIKFNYHRGIDVFSSAEKEKLRHLAEQFELVKSARITNL